MTVDTSTIQSDTTFLITGQKDEVKTTPSDWLVEKLKDAIVTPRPVSTMYRGDTIPKIEEWKVKLNSESSHQKKLIIKRAIDWIINDQSLTVDQTNFILQLIENVALSRRVSNLNEHRFYERIVKNIDNHVVTLKGLEGYISKIYPTLDVVYTNDPRDKSLETVSDRLNDKNSVWIVFRHQYYLHKTLLYVSLDKNGKKLVDIWDSLGCTNSYNEQRNYCEKERAYINNLIILVNTVLKGEVLASARYVQKPRQKDSSNCSSFILSDLENALDLLKAGKSFTVGHDSPHIINHPDFFEISQYKNPKGSDSIKKIYRRNMRVCPDYDPNKKVGNACAVIYSAHVFNFFMTNISSYVEAGYFKPGESDSDEIDQGCVVM